MGARGVDSGCEVAAGCAVEARRNMAMNSSISRGAVGVDPDCEVAAGCAMEAGCDMMKSRLINVW